MGKITVKHYLNTNLKPYIIGDDKYYRIYVLIRANNKNTKLKSFVSDDEYTIDEYGEILKQKDSDVYKNIQKEIEVFTGIIEKIEGDGKVFDIQVFNVYMENYGIRLIDKLVEFLRWQKEIEILKIECRSNTALENKYFIRENMQFSFSRENLDENRIYPKADNLKFIIEALRYFTKAVNYSINDDLFIYQWFSDRVLGDFSAFYSKYIQDIQKKEGLKEDEYFRSKIPYLMNDTIPVVNMINEILRAMINREAVDILV